MTVDDIRNIIKNGESEVLELKKTTGQLTRAAESLCAFLNINVRSCTSARSTSVYFR